MLQHHLPGCPMLTDHRGVEVVQLLSPLGVILHHGATSPFLPCAPSSPVHLPPFTLLSTNLPFPPLCTPNLPFPLLTTSPIGVLC
ncbi:unnamed protein product [Gadus morhua 'NCC']